MSEVKLTEYKKPNGTKIKLNSEKATIEKARSLGWKPSKLTAAQKKAEEEAELAALEAEINAEEG